MAHCLSLSLNANTVLTVTSSYMGIGEKSLERQKTTEILEEENPVCVF